MGALVIASLFLMGLIVTEAKSLPQESPPFAYMVKGMAVPPPHSASPAEHQRLQATATNYQPFPIKGYHYSSYGPSYEILSPSYAAQPHQAEEYSAEHREGEFENQEQFLGDLQGYAHYKTSNSFNFEGPRQLETINTKSYHKEVEPYDVAGFTQDDHQHDEEHAEVHYHQHKHVHKHNHKQEHLHNHKQQHQHQHGHKHQHQGQHDHKHVGEHKHDHQQKHVHSHKGEHDHKHHHGHHHSHHGEHKHDHKHHQDHKHDHHHGHKHSHHSDHKHEHHQDHKHDHHHAHSHQGMHKHQHHHQGSHKHQHGHKHESGHHHGHKHEHGHKHSYHKH
ncbi:sex-determining region Y protein-like [Tenebrio molitor]|uniref:sex-determining region Y protein-like n=1 Tax=Tenebrio molitor TaxID=7067 RepID=UPI003624A52D